MIIEVKVKPKSGKQEVVRIDSNRYFVYLKSEPENNKANIEMLKLLRSYFKKEVILKTGKTSKNKVIEVKNAN